MVAASARTAFRWPSSVMIAALVLFVSSRAHAEQVCIEGPELMTLPATVVEMSIEHVAVPSTDEADAGFGLVCVSAQDSRCMPAHAPGSASWNGADHMALAFIEPQRLHVFFDYAAFELRHGGKYQGRSASGVRFMLLRPPRSQA